VPARRHTFPRARRLKRRRLIRPLFEPGRTDVGRVSAGVLLIRYRVVPREDTGTGAPLQVGFAPGRRARTNAGRTRLRRLLRETFRLHQHGLLERFEARPDSLTAMLIFRGNEATAAEDIRRDLPVALQRLEARLRAPAAGAAPAPPTAGDP
jgi:ribonuclease P protein component